MNIQFKKAIKCIIESRISFGNFVIDKEKIEHFMGYKTSDAVDIYEIENGKILRFWICDGSIQSNT